jgi:ABC-type branched-subunit amino acid transport system ATPase component
MNQPLLAIRSLRAAYGKIEALKSVDLDINRGEIVALIGANGAGKSTLMMTTSASRAPAQDRSCSTAATSPRCRPTRSPGCALRRRPKAAGFSRA